MTGNLRLAFILEAVDRATKPIRNIGNAVARLAEPARRVGAVFASASRLMVGAAQAAGAAALAAGTALFAFKRVADAVDDINDTAQMLGMTTQEVQRLGYAAQMSGSNTDEMTQSLVFLNKNMGEARNGSKEMQEWMKRVGITMADLQNPAFTASDAAMRIADTFKRVGDTGGNAGKKIEASTALMGRAGFRMIQMLSGGSAGIKALGDEAENTGAVLDDKTVKAMTDFNDQWDRMRAVMFGAVANAMGSVAPMLMTLFNRVTAWTSANRKLIADKLEEYVRRVSDAMPAFIDGLGKVWTFLGRVVSIANAVAEALGGWPNLLGALAGLMAVRMVTSVLQLAAAMGILNVAAMTNPFVLILTAVLALIAALPLIVMHWDKIIAKLREVQAAVPEWMQRAFSAGSFGLIPTAPPRVAAAPATGAAAGAGADASGRDLGTVTVRIEGDSRAYKVTGVKPGDKSPVDVAADSYNGQAMGW